MYNYKKFMAELEQKNPAQPEFIQAASEIVASVIDTVNANPMYLKNKILDRIVVPNRIVEFKVEWEDDNHEIQVNRGWRVQFNNAIGPYKGGLRFDPTVNLSILKFLGFEQVFKNSLTTLPMGGAKGGANFDPKQSPHTPGKRCSDSEVMRFCQSFMTELFHHIGPNTDVPAGDMNVGGREIGYLFGQYKRIANEWTGVLTGKGLAFGGSLIRPEATGYGDVYFAENMLATRKDTLEGKVCAISGSGNVASFAAQKLIRLGAKRAVTSPTFCLVVEHPTDKFLLVHMDLYRLHDADEVLTIGWEDYLARGAVLFVEWPDRAGDLIPAAARHVRFTLGDSEDARIIEFTP